MKTLDFTYWQDGSEWIGYVRLRHVMLWATGLVAVAGTGLLGRGCRLTKRASRRSHGASRARNLLVFRSSLDTIACRVPRWGTRYHSQFKAIIRRAIRGRARRIHDFDHGCSRCPGLTANVRQKMHISKSRRPLKPCFIERCPHCRRIGEFWLIQLSGHVGPFGGTGYSVACIACQFEKLISNADAEKFDRLAGKYQQVVGGLVSIEAFEKTIDGMALRAIDEIRKEGRVWMCAKCEEENPQTFDSCWQCGGASPRV
jgi:hypothetical protein